MRQDTEQTVALMQGTAALPRKNGELVFQEPWESRAFGMAVALHRRGVYPWDTFREGLIADIARWEAQARGGSQEAWRYYERWLTALQEVLVSRGVLTAEEIEARMGEFASVMVNDREQG